MKATQETETRGLNDINLTPLVDVSLTLVIIFMVSSPFLMQSEIKVSTPALKKASQPAAASDLKAEIYLKPNGSLFLNGDSVAVESLSDSLQVLLAASESKQVVISADEAVIYDDVIGVMDRARQSGAQKLSIVKRR